MTSTAVRVPDASTPEWACSWDPAALTYTWKRRDGTGSPIKLYVNGAWSIGDAPCQPRDPRLPARGMVVVQRGTLADWDGDKYHRIASTYTGDVLGYGDNLWDPGVQGGDGIDLHPPEPTQDEQAAISAIVQRNPIALVDRQTGTILTRRALGNYFEYRLDRGRDPIQNLPHFPRGSGMETPNVEAVDKYHLARALMRPLGEWRRTGAPHLRQFLLFVAEDVRASYTLDGKEQDQGSSWVPYSLKNLLRGAHANPGTGGEIVRGLAWSLRAGVIACELNPPNRREWVGWLAAMVDYVATVQMPNGYFANHLYGYGIDQDEPWLLYGLDKSCGEQPSWQAVFLIRALWEAQKQVPDLHARVLPIIAKHHAGWSAAPRVPDSWAPGVMSLPCYLVTSRSGVIEPSITQGVGPGRGEYDYDLVNVYREAGL